MSGCSSDVTVGTAPTVTATFVDADGAPADPSAIEVVTLAPDDTRTVYTSPDATITNPAVGTWVFTFPAAITLHGKWWVRVAGTATIVAASEVSFRVRPSNTAAPL